MLVRAKQVQHLSTRQRARIRYSWATDHGLARHYGVSVSTIRLVRATAQQDHPAHVAAIVRRYRSHAAIVRQGGLTANLSDFLRTIPSVQIRTDGLHVEGGPDLPEPVH
jgi:hypothetical protein